ncbi:MAG: radical SAM family heme chaperone HemW [Sporolactobacillus sp.]|jgi:oxygen-independent coproporphyrinogen-3 oxidase|nr:radical SAM family heme chaperone HemW [Sporolactobacillus sp.]
MTESIPRGAYIHIPFCDHICYYCDFNKFFMKNQPVDAYLDALAHEMAFYAAMGPVQSVYVGGGTPTALNDEQFERMLNEVHRYFVHSGLREFTVEANPENLDERKLLMMKRYGVTRLSIGVQSFDDRLLKAIGRAHTADRAAAVIHLANSLGFDNLTLDLMFALPGQTEASLRTSLARAVRLGVPHISIYSLQIEPRTIFYHRLRNGKLRLPGQDIEADMFGEIILFLEERGFRHYEISNFARPGFEGIHNSLYWRNDEYYGIGAGAHGYVAGNRYANAASIKKYIRTVGEQGNAATTVHRVTQQERMEEEMFLGLRMMKGVSKSRFYRRFGRPLEEVYGTAIAQLKRRGLLDEQGDRLALTMRGIFLGNNVFEAFLLS